MGIKKKLETDINELEIALDHANKANAEAHKTIKRYQNQFRDVETAYEEECRQRQEIADKAGLADRRANALQGELEESRSLMDSAERGKKQAEMELHDARVAVNDRREKREERREKRGERREKRGEERGEKRGER